MKKAVFVGLVVALGIGLGGLALAQDAGYDGTETTQKAIDELRKETLQQSQDLQGVYAQSTPDQKAIAKAIDQVRRDTLMDCEHGQGFQGLYQGLYAQATPGQKAIGKL
jgi:uncharacterized protein HemX